MHKKRNIKVMHIYCPSFLVITDNEQRWQRAQRVLGTLPPGKFPSPSFLPGNPSPTFFCSTLFWLVACFAHVRIEDSNRNRFVSTA